MAGASSTQQRSSTFAAANVAATETPALRSRRSSSLWEPNVRRCVTVESTPSAVIPMAMLLGTDATPHPAPWMRPARGERRGGTAEQAGCGRGCGRACPHGVLGCVVGWE
eukprot:354041-Chlamydomonas_euryale.AAC.13